MKVFAKQVEQERWLIIRSFCIPFINVYSGIANLYCWPRTLSRRWVKHQVDFIAKFINPIKKYSLSVKPKLLNASRRSRWYSIIKFNDLF